MDINFDYHKINGVKLHTAQAGPQDGPLVILLHGFPEFWYGWKNQIAPLAQAGFCVLAPDQRGYNLSDKPRGIGAYQVGNMAADVVGLIDALGRDKACLVGHDWGAAVAWETAIRCPQRLEKLVILNVPHPAVMQRFIFSRASQLRKSWYIFAFQPPALPEWLLSRNHYASLRRAMVNSARPDTFSQEVIDLYIQAWSQPGALTAMLNWYRAIFRSGLRSSWNPNKMIAARIHVPTLMLWGALDFALSREMAQPSIDLCAEGKLVFLEDATHWVQHDRPKEVNARLLAFLT